MKVAIFTDNDFDKVNGVTTALTAVLRYAPSGITPRIYTAATLGSDEPHYLALSSQGMPIPFYGEMRMYVPHWKEYLRRVQEDRIDVLHLTTPGPMGLAALWVAHRTGLPLVGSFHTDLAAYTSLLSGSAFLGAFMRHYMRWMYGRCQRVLVPSDATRRMLVEAGTRADRIALWGRGVDTTLFTPARRDQRLRERWGVSGRRLAVLYVGRLSREKGLDLLAPVSARLRAARIDHRLVVAGDGPMRSELMAACPDAVFTGPLGREAVADVFASADVFVFPSRTDTAGNVVLEAQASGLPVIVSDAGGPREHLRPGVTGRVVSGIAPDAWCTALRAVAGDPAQQELVRRAAREYALSRRWEVALEPLFETYRAVHTARAVPHAA